MLDKPFNPYTQPSPSNAARQRRALCSTPASQHTTSTHSGPVFSRVFALRDPNFHRASCEAIDCKGSQTAPTRMYCVCVCTTAYLSSVNREPYVGPSNCTVFPCFIALKSRGQCFSPCDVIELKAVAIGDFFP